MQTLKEIETAFRLCTCKPAKSVSVELVMQKKISLTQIQIIAYKIVYAWTY